MCFALCGVCYQVTVQAGCRVQQVADALKAHGLTLQNYASIREQQIGGFTQVGAKGGGGDSGVCVGGRGTGFRGEVGCGWGPHPLLVLFRGGVRV